MTLSLGFLKRAARRMDKEMLNPKIFKALEDLAKTMPEGLPHIIGHGGSVRKGIDAIFKPAPAEKSVKALKSLYKKIPGIGTVAPLSRRPMGGSLGEHFAGGFGRLIGKRKGNIKVYHGTNAKKSILEKGIIPEKRDGLDIIGLKKLKGEVIWTTPDIEKAKKYGETIFETSLPIKDIKYMRFNNELMSNKPIKPSKLTRVK